MLQFFWGMVIQQILTMDMVLLINSVEKRAWRYLFLLCPLNKALYRGRFKPTHRPIGLSTMVAACVRRFETPTPLNYGRTEAKKDISMLSRAFLSYLTLKRSARVMW